MTTFPKLQKWVLFTACFALGVVALGAYTRLKDAGLGCPDWPGCYGQLWLNEQAATQPIDSHKAWIEMIHRYAASTLGLLILTLNVAAFRFRKNPLFPKKLAMALLLLVVFQGALGMWTVTLKLLPPVVMGHLLGGFLTVALLFAMWQKLGEKPFVVAKPCFVKAARLALLLVLIQIALGAWTSTQYAALACPDFPTCQGQWIPTQFDFKNAFHPWPMGPNGYEFGVLDNAARVTIHWLHRVNAIVLALFLFALSLVGLKKQASQPLKLQFILMLGLLGLQISLGILNVVTHLSLHVAVSHNLVAALLFVTVLLINTRLAKP